jgi:hypothetical protein
LGGTAHCHAYKMPCPPHHTSQQAQCPKSGYASKFFGPNPGDSKTDVCCLPSTHTMTDFLEVCATVVSWHAVAWCATDSPPRPSWHGMVHTMICLSVCLFVCVSVCLSVCLCVHALTHRQCQWVMRCNATGQQTVGSQNTGHLLVKHERIKKIP